MRSGLQALLVSRSISIFFTSSSVMLREERNSVGKELLYKRGNTANESSTLDCIQKKELNRLALTVSFSYTCSL